MLLTGRMTFKYYLCIEFRFSSIVYMSVDWSKG
jgi:hypothetical protein